MSNPGRRPTADLYVTGGPYDPDDLSWTEGQWWPADLKSRARSSVMNSIYRLAYDPGTRGIGNDAECPLCLSYGMLAVAHLARNASGLLARGAAERKLVVGFNSGEPYLIGAVRARGFKPRFEVIG
jgi:hypothetical protein